MPISVCEESRRSRSRVACVRAWTWVKGFGAERRDLLEARRALETDMTCCLWRW